MLDQMRRETQGQRRGASTFEFALLVISIAAVLALVIFAFGSYVAR
jgi:Flp pilus assembly protein TadG